jgi:hypothetical protein
MPTTTSHLNSLNIIVKRPRHMALEIQILAKNRNINITGLMGSSLSLSLSLSLSQVLPKGRQFLLH